MYFPFSLSAHQRACAWKQQERQGKINSLLSIFSSPVSVTEEKIHALSLSQIVSKCSEGTITPSDILQVYGKKTLRAHLATNCLTDVRFTQALHSSQMATREQTCGLSDSASIVSDRPLLGVPVSIKDTIDIAGHDTTMACSENVGKPVFKSSAIVRLLQDAGALIHVKTTVPPTLVSMETRSDVFGITRNPYNPAFTCGASSGGGAALLALGGSKIEIGSDVGGSVRLPAHFCGLWSLKGSAGRFPTWGHLSTMKGLEGVNLVCAPMANSLDDLIEFWKRVVNMKPWHYDHSCVPIPWRPVDALSQNHKLKWGIIWDDGIIPPSPACKRALSMVIDALKSQGHEVVEFSPPGIADGLKIGYQLLFVDGGTQLKSCFRRTETINADLCSIFSLLSLPQLLKKVLAYIFRPIDPLYACFLEIFHAKSIAQEQKLVIQRDEYRALWHEQWSEQGLDFVLTPPAPIPAFEHGSADKVSLMSAGMTFIFNLLDYSAGNIPVTLVNRSVDAYPPEFYSSPQFLEMNSVAKGPHSVYDAEKMHGLPVGVQIVGRRFEEEKVLEGMRIIESALLRHHGHVFPPRS